MSKSSRRRGFTLPEVLVTVTIVAVLAAVMVPAVINQVAKGDVPAIAGDLAGIRTAITTFAADTRHFPRRLSDLGGATLLQTDTDINNVQYGLDAQNNYRGPYAPITSGHVGPTGAIFANTLTTNGLRAICMRDSVDVVSKISPEQIEQIRRSLDQNAPAISGNSGVSSYGSVTYQLASASGVVTVVPGSVKICLTSF